MGQRYAQAGTSLVEVLVALSILALGLLGAALVQLKALQYTDSARMSTQASFIAYDMLDRIRANAGADYTVASRGDEHRDNIRDQDLNDFASNVASFGGPGAKGSISLERGVHSVRISWDDSRAAGASGTQRSLLLGSKLSAEAGGAQ
ncbi:MULTISPECIES: type IV pilus modification protein PilV [Pseudomonas]|uniref:Type IV pilus modification protein PilV n=1 Tax=Pseudomonas sessilinigenes TaxID=658629 RepID=A0ABX8MPA2_9PSED|nr:MULTISPECIES: type IV pilus modification protein PilV [Pseudomonas]AZC25997.1 Type IV fimbrial biogenesis protein PilV [Pseudomonas sessilinigenes]QIH10905.1 type IV pilus modification protein PilV [Pseudomonas sp. BIOMIG1BAC]QXH39969.1 type IV pilus modification protein PilV [Pseudomonas sessilinigenes]